MATREFNPGAGPQIESRAQVSAISSTTDEGCRLLTVCAGVSGAGRWGRRCHTGTVPSLRLQGRWLDRAGFAVGAAVRVLVTNGRLVVEVVNDTPPPDDCQVHDD
jgi:hypothetical protein